MERLLHLWDELDEALGLLRHAWLTTIANLSPAPARDAQRGPWPPAPRHRGT